MHKVVLIKGDGIGPEIADAVVEILAAAQAPLEFVEHKAGLSCIEECPSGLPEETLDAIKEHGLALKGPTTTPIGTGHKSVNVTLRKKLDLYANVRPARTLPGVKTRFDNVDLIIVRENVEDTYAGVEHSQTPNVAQGLKLITRPGSMKIARYAFEMTKAIGRKTVTAYHKANIHKATDGLFLESFKQVASENSDVESNDILVDNACMQLVSRPEQFDVLVGPNLYGDILSDLCAGLVGGLGVAPGANIGDNCAVFEAVHGSAPDIAGKGLANPTALLQSAIMLLQHLGYTGIAELVNAAMIATMEAGIRTKDLGGEANTAEFTQAIVERIEAMKGEYSLDRSEAAQISVSTENITKDADVKVVGVDVFVRSNGMPQAPKTVGNLSLQMMSNRGTKVFPGPTPDGMLVDAFCCRYRTEQGDVSNEEISALINAISEAGLPWVHIEKLQTFDGEQAFSKAQGE